MFSDLNRANTLMEGSSAVVGPPSPTGTAVQTVLEFWLNSQYKNFPKAVAVVARAKAKLLIPCEEMDEIVSIVGSVVQAGEGAARAGRFRRTRLIFWLIFGILTWVLGLAAAFGAIDASRNPGTLEYVIFDVILLLAVFSIGLVCYKHTCRQETIIMLDQAKRVASMLSVWNKAKYLRFGFAFEEYSTKGLCLQAVAGGPSAEFCPAKASAELSRITNYGIQNASKWKWSSFGHSTEPPPQLMKAKSFQNFEDYSVWQTDEERIKTGIRNSFEGDYAILLKYSAGFKRKPRIGDKELIKSSLLSLRNKRDQSSIQRTPMGTKRQISENSQVEKYPGPKNIKVPRVKPTMEKSEEIFILSGGDEPWEYAIPSEDLGSVQQNISPVASDSNRSNRNDFKLGNPALIACENLAIPEVSHHSDEEFSAQSSIHKIKGPINSRESRRSNYTQQDDDNKFAEVEQHLNNEDYESGVQNFSRDEIPSPAAQVPKPNPKNLGTHIEGRSSKTVIHLGLKPEIVHDEDDWQPQVDYEKPDHQVKEREVIGHSNSNMSHKSSRTKIVTKDIVVESPKHAAAGLLPVPIEVRNKLKERSRDCSVDSNDSKPIPGGRASRDRSVDSNDAVRATRIVRTTSNESKLNSLSKTSSLKNIPKTTKTDETLLSNPIHQDPGQSLQMTSKLIDIEDFSAPK